MSPTTLPIKPLVSLLQNGSVDRIMTAAKFARLVDDSVSNVRPALDAGHVERAQGEAWAVAAGFSPAVVWPPAPLEQARPDSYAKPFVVEVQRKATDLFMVAAEAAGKAIVLPRGDRIPLDFHDELPPTRANHRGRHFSWHDALDEPCKANPGKWLRIMERPNSAAAVGRRKAIRESLGEGFEVEVRPNKPTDGPSDPHFVWVRWVG